MSNIIHIISMIQVSKVLEKSLWEYDISKLTYESEIVTIRALCFGEIDDIKLICKEIWSDKVRAIFIKNITEIDLKSQNFWKKYFQIDTENTHNQSMYDKLNTPIFSRSFG